MPGDGPAGRGQTAGLRPSRRWPKVSSSGPRPNSSTYAPLTSLMLPPFCPNAPGMTDYRVEKDFLGELKVPKDAYWGAQTQRAIENFPISGIRFGRRFLYALGLIKMAAAQTNMELGLLDSKIGKAIVQACQEVMDGKLDAQFPLDVFQTGSGTSTNMNANEVIANRANEILGHPLGEKGPVHPNDHANMGQSSNDVIPSAIHVAALLEIDQGLLPALRELEESLSKKAKEFDPIVKAGRTHLMDATPIRLGQEFSGYQSEIDHGIRRVSWCRAALRNSRSAGPRSGPGSTPIRSSPVGSSRRSPPPRTRSSESPRITSRPRRRRTPSSRRAGRSGPWRFR